MTCEYLGNPEPKVTWLRVKDEREFIQGIQMVSFFIQQTLNTYLIAV